MLKKYYFLTFSLMRKISSLSIFLSLAICSTVFAETGVTTPILPGWPAPLQADMTPSITPDMNAAPNQAATLAPTNKTLGSSLWEFKSVNCNTNPTFSTNSCDQCFDGGSVKVGDNINGLFDNWINNSPNIMVAYKEEQKTPNIVRFGNTTWTSNPANDAQFWKYSSDIIWVQAGSGGKNQYILPAGQTVKFIESELGAGYKLEKTDRKNGDIVGMIRFPLVSHVVDSAANESIANTTYECATLTLSAPAVTPAKEVKPTPKEITTTKTGPETLLLIIAAFFIAFGLMFSLRRKI